MIAIKSFVIFVMAMGLMACSQQVEQEDGLLDDMAHVKNQQDTINKIKNTGVVVVGYRDSSIPFSYIADKPNKPVGYAHDLQLKIIDALKQQLNLPDLKVRYHLITSQTRIPLIQNGSVDFECGSTTNNQERQRKVDFSVGFFEIGTRLLTSKNSGIQDFEDLKGKTLVTTAGTTSERLIRQHNDGYKMGIHIISAKDHKEAFLMLENGRAAAFMMDDVLLAGEKAKSKNPNRWHIVGTPQSFEIYGCMMRKGDKEFKKLIDDTLTKVYESGEIFQIYDKWFMSPIPPKNINMDFAMSDNLRVLLADPHDDAQPKNVAAITKDVLHAVRKGNEHTINDELYGYDTDEELMNTVKEATIQAINVFEQDELDFSSSMSTANDQQP